MTHEQVKQVVNFVMSKMFSVSSMTKDQLATAYLEAHPDTTAPPIPDTAPVHTDTAPPTLRERAAQINNCEWDNDGNPLYSQGQLIQFASEVSGEKDREIAELELEVKQWRAKYFSDMNF